MSQRGGGSSGPGRNFFSSMVVLLDGISCATGRDGSTVGAQGTFGWNSGVGGDSYTALERIFDGDTSCVAWLGGPMCGRAMTGMLATLGRKQRLGMRGHNRSGFRVLASSRNSVRTPRMRLSLQAPGLGRPVGASARGGRVCHRSAGPSPSGPSWRHDGF